MALVPTLFLIIFLEGYVVLSTELLSIRLLIPFAGSGTDTVSIIIAAVLMPLAFGYAFGGGARKDIRKRLIRNLLISALLLTPGLSHAFLNWGFDILFHKTGISNRLVLTALYAGLFLVTPVFLLGQTVPLISNYFSRERLSVMAGRILFFSTMGSFMGAVFCTLVLMTFAGVHNAVNVTIGAIALLAFILSKKKINPQTITISLALLVSLALNSPMMMKKLHIVSNNKYNTIAIDEREDDGTRLLKMNRTYASAIYQYSTDPVVSYHIFIDESFIQPMIEEGTPRDVLILGAGGFALGRTDTKNNYTFVDIDGSLKKISEEDFLKEKLSPNKKFEPIEARAFMRQDQKKYDMIVLDLMLDPVSTPEYLVTQEFFQMTKEHLKDGGVIVGNYFASPTFSDPFSKHLDNTLRTVFPHLNRQVVTPYNVWKQQDDWTNIVYSYVHHTKSSPNIYTDDKSTAPFDRPVNLGH